MSTLLANSVLGLMPYITEIGNMHVHHTRLVNRLENSIYTAIVAECNRIANDCDCVEESDRLNLTLYRAFAYNQSADVGQRNDRIYFILRERERFSVRPLYSTYFRTRSTGRPQFGCKVARACFEVPDGHRMAPLSIAVASFLLLLLGIGLVPNVVAIETTGTEKPKMPRPFRELDFSEEHPTILKTYNIL